MEAITSALRAVVSQGLQEARRGAGRKRGRCATHYNNATLRAAAALRLRRGHAPAPLPPRSDSGNGDFTRFEWYCALPVVTSTLLPFQLNVIQTRSLEVS